MEEIRIPWADWKIEERIGKGGFGMVYKIRHRDEFNVEEYAAMKIIRFPQDDHENAVLLSEGYDKDSIVAYNRERLDKVINEYAIMMKMKGHRNIVRCDDCKAVPHEDGMGWDVFIRMELLTPLHTKLANGEMSEADVVQLGKDLCQALIQCEKEKIVHRDIKPENIFVNDYGDYKLGDFGISRTLEHTTNATRTGSLRFMAPEVYKGQKYGTTVDIYSLGLVMYWLLNNRRMPFAPMNHPATVQENLEAMRRRLDGSESIPAPANGNEALKMIIVKACSFNPEERFSSAKELYNELSSLALKEDIQSGIEFNRTITETVLDKKEPTEDNGYNGGNKQKKDVEKSPELIERVVPPKYPEEDSYILSEGKKTIQEQKRKTPKKQLVYIAAIALIIACLLGGSLFFSNANNEINDLSENEIAEIVLIIACLLGGSLLFSSANNEINDLSEYAIGDLVSLKITSIKKKYENETGSRDRYYLCLCKSNIGHVWIVVDDDIIDYQRSKIINTPLKGMVRWIENYKGDISKNFETEKCLRLLTNNS